MSDITIQKISITDLDTDCIVNAANSYLAAGGGVCGAIFRAAGYDQLTSACDGIGHCPTGGAVITPGFQLKARYIVHAVGPIWHGGHSGEREDLYHAYQNSLLRAMENDCHSIAFPLISAGIYGYPADQAWKVAIEACRNFLNTEKEYEISIIFAVLSEQMYALGEKALKNG